MGGLVAKKYVSSLRTLVVALTVALGLFGLTTVPSPAHAVVPSAVPGKTPAIIDGEVYALAKVGTTMVVGGNFTQARSWGSATVQARAGILAFDTATGQLVSGFAPVLDGTVYSLVPGPVPNTVLAAGTFKKINGKSFGRVVLINLTTGARVNTFKSANINGRINSMAVSGNRLYVGGNFTTVDTLAHSGITALNYTTGVLDPFVNNQTTQRHNDTGTGAKSAVGVTELDVTPSGDRVVAVGNFKKVDGIARDQVVVLDTSGASSVVSSTWATTRYTPYCSKNAFDSTVRDVSFSPDGSYFVVTSTGGPYSGTLCDSAARFETYANGTTLQPTWVDYTGGDTLWGVEITNDAVFVGGHMRWMNNINGGDSAQQGAVPRPGIAALSVQTGMPLGWNPGRHTRGEAAYVFLATEDGVYFGSDTDWIGNFQYERPRIGFFPYEGGHAVADDSEAVLPADILIGSPSNVTDNLAIQSFNGTTVGARTTVSGTGVTWSQTRGAFWIGGKVYYGNNDGWLYSRTFKKGAFGPAVKLDPYHDPYWTGVATGSGSSVYTGVVPALFSSFSSGSSYITGLAYDNGRLFYTTNGSSTLNARYFNADSGIVGSEVFNVSNSISWSDANLAFVSNHQLYFVSKTTGQLKKIPLVNNLPTGSVTVVDASRDWRGRSVFLGPQNVNVPPVADFTSSCLELACDFDASASTDPDGSVVSYAWDFGDGATATGATAHHDFAAGGDQSVTVTVTDNEGASTPLIKTVPVTAPAESNIEFVGAATVGTLLVSSASVTVPAGVQDGDTLVLYGTFANSAPGVTAPAGWTEAGTASASGMTSTVWTTTATPDSAGSLVTVGMTTASKAAMTLVAYRNASATIAAGAIASGVDSSQVTHTAPNVTAPSGAWLLSYWSDKSSWTTGWTTPGDQLLRGTAIGIGSGRITSAMVDSGARVATPGTWGGEQASVDQQASTRAINWTIALSPAP